MYQLDQRFFHKDGSFDVEAAMEAGRKARSQGLFEGCGIVADLAIQLFQSVRRAAAGSALTPKKI